MSNQRLIPLIGAMLLALCVNTSASAQNTQGALSEDNKKTMKALRNKSESESNLRSVQPTTSVAPPLQSNNAKKSTKAKQTTKPKKSTKANRRHACELGYVRYGRTCIPAK